MDNFRKKLDYILKHNLFIQTVFRKTGSLVMQILGKFIKTDNNLVLLSGHGRKYNDSPRAIFEYMIKDPKYKHLTFVWALEEPEKVKIPRCKKVKADSLSYFITALKAKYWITCVNIERSLKFKKKNTIYLNTWHGVAINEMGNAVKGRKDFDWSYIDYVCYSGEYEKQIIIRDFNAKEKNMLPSGLPRNDELYHVSKDKIKKIRKKLEIPEDKKIILYAPTWRDSTDFGESYQLIPPINWEKWRNELSDQYVVLLRTHAYTTKLMGVEFNDFIRDCSSYPNVNHLLMAADVMISDYSSIIFDYAILGKPILCFGYDYEQYSKYRGFYFDLDKELPSGIIRDEKNLLRHIRKMNYEKECEKTRRFRDKFINYGGQATEICVRNVFKEVEGVDKEC